MKLKHLILVFILAQIISFALYGNTLQGQFVYDDQLFQRRQELREIGHLPKLFFEDYLPLNFKNNAAYRPITMVSFALNFILFGESPMSFHIVNIVLNGIVIFLVFLITHKLFHNLLLAGVTALLYAFLPIHTEVVASIKSRDEIFSTLFALLAWFVFLKATEDKEKLNYKGVLLSSGLFYLGVLSKELIIFLPALYLLIFWLQKTAPILQVVKLGLLFLPANVAYFALRLTALGADVFSTDPVEFVIDPLRFTDFWTRIWTTFKIAFIYISKTFIPLNLSATYQYNHLALVSNPLNSWEALLGITFLFVLIFLAWFKKSRVSALGIGALTFLVGYFIVSKFVFQVSEIAAERWMYFPSLGLAMIEGWVVMKTYGYQKVVGVIMFAAALLVYGSILFNRNQVWVSRRALYESMVKDAPQSIQGHINMGKVYFDEGDIDRAIEESNIANNIYPEHAPAINLMGAIAHVGKNYPLAEQLFLKSLAIRPGFPDTHILYALTLTKMGRFEESLRQVAPLKEVNPSDSRVRFIMALNLYKLGRPDLAKRYFDWDSRLSYEQKIKLLQEF